MHILFSFKTKLRNLYTCQIKQSNYGNNNKKSLRQHKHSTGSDSVDESFDKEQTLPELGIGLETAKLLAGRGCRVIIADKANCDKSKEEIIKETGNDNIVIKNFDLASLKSVRQLAKDINATEERLDILINNAVACGIGNSYTEDGLHIGMQTNHFGSFLLTHLLVGLLKQSTPSRVIFLTSLDAYAGNISAKDLNLPEGTPITLFSEFMVYAKSKLCNIVTANEFAKKLEGTRVTVNSVHPGLADTPIFKNVFEGLEWCSWQKKVLYFIYCCTLKQFSKTARESAQSVAHVALAEEVENISGKLFVDCKFFRMPSLAQDSTYSRQIWEASEKFVKLSPEEKLKFRTVTLKTGR